MSPKAKSKSSAEPKPVAAPRTPEQLLVYYLPVAKKLPAAEVQICRANTRIALTNVRFAIRANFGPAEDPARPARIKEVHAALPKIKLKRVLALPNLARALLLAANKATGKPASDGEINERLAVVSSLREPMLTQAETLAGRGIFSKEVVAKIRAGSGKYDMASDGAALVSLYAEHAREAAGKHPFTEEEFAKVREASEWLLERLTPTGAKPRTPVKRPEAEDVRDRLWTLLLKRYTDVRVIAYYFHQEAYEQYAPRLQSRLAEAPAPNEEESEDEPESESEGEGED
jgi:hypothetical protein